MGEIHYNDTGTALRATIVDERNNVIDVSAASSLILKVKKPDGTTFSWEASLTNDGTDGIIEYVTADGDLDNVGVWEIQGEVTLPSGKWNSNITTFRVHRNLS